MTVEPRGKTSMRMCFPTQRSRHDHHRWRSRAKFSNVQKSMSIEVFSIRHSGRSRRWTVEWHSLDLHLSKSPFVQGGWWALPNGVFPCLPANIAGLWLQTSLSSSFPNVTNHPPDIPRDSLCLSGLRHVLSSSHWRVADSSGARGTRVNRDKRTELRPEEEPRLCSLDYFIPCPHHSVESHWRSRPPTTDWRCPRRSHLVPLAINCISSILINVTVLLPKRRSPSRDATSCSDLHSTRSHLRHLCSPLRNLPKRIKLSHRSIWSHCFSKWGDFTQLWMLTKPVSSDHHLVFPLS